MDKPYKSPTDRVTDLQAVIYGIAARLEVATNVRDVPEVDLNWIYTSTKTKDVRPSRLRQTLTILEDGLADVLDTAHRMKADFLSCKDRNVDEMPYDLRECDRYGGCPHKIYCTAHRAHIRAGLDEQPDVPIVSNMSKDLLAKLRLHSNSPSPVAPVETPAPASEPEPETTSSDPDPDRVKASPEPKLPDIDTSGLDTPIPPGTAPINSAEASPAVSPEDPPAPAAAPEKPKPKAKRTKKSAKTGDVEVIEADFVEMKAVMEVDFEVALQSLLQQAIRQKRYELASQIAQAIAVAVSEA
jgi:hypothetical protein